MNLPCIKCLKFSYNNNIKIDREINRYSYCIDCSFKKFETIDKEKISDLLESLDYI